MVACGLVEMDEVAIINARTSVGTIIPFTVSKGLRAAHFNFVINWSCYDAHY